MTDISVCFTVQLVSLPLDYCMIIIIEHLLESIPDSAPVLVPLYTVWIYAFQHMDMVLCVAIKCSLS